MTHVVFAADVGFAAPLSVALHSLAAHNSGVQATVIERGYSQGLRCRVRGDTAGSIHLTWVRMPHDLMGVPNTEYLPPAALYRLLLPDLLPDADRVIYLDCDTLIADDLSALASMPVDGELAAVRDAGAPVAAGPSGTDWQNLGLSPGTPYFNSGVLVADLERWRSERIGRRAIEVLRAHSPRWGDQCALNAVVAGRWHELARRWNLQTADVQGRGLAWAMWRDDVEHAIADPAVIHFTERDKPWLDGTTHPYAPIWRSWQSRTPFADWRPEGAGHRFAARVARRVTGRVRR